MSAGLRDAVLRLAAAASKVSVLRNGADLDGFCPAEDRAAARAELGLDGPALLSVGHLIERKGHDLAIQALTLLPGGRLVSAESRPERGAPQALAARLGVAGRVGLVGQVPHAHSAAAMRLPTCWFSRRSGRVRPMLCWRA